MILKIHGPSSCLINGPWSRWFDGPDIFVISHIASSHTMLRWLLQCASQQNSNRLPHVLWIQRLGLLSRFRISRVPTSFLWISRSTKLRNETFVVVWLFSSFWSYTADLAIIATLLIMLIFAIWSCWSSPSMTNTHTLPLSKNMPTPSMYQSCVNYSSTMNHQYVPT